MTNQKQIKQMQAKLTELYEKISQYNDPILFSTVHRIVEIELLLELECNQ